MFEKGDKVLVTRASTEGEGRKWADSWVPSMDKAIGKACEIIRINEGSITLGGKGGLWNYPPFVLKLIGLKGQQLEFWEDI